MIGMEMGSYRASHGKANQGESSEDGETHDDGGFGG